MIEDVLERSNGFAVDVDQVALLNEVFALGESRLPDRFGGIDGRDLLETRAQETISGIGK